MSPTESNPNKLNLEKCQKKKNNIIKKNNTNCANNIKITKKEKLNRQIDGLIKKYINCNKQNKTNICDQIKNTGYWINETNIKLTIQLIIQNKLKFDIYKILFPKLHELIKPYLDNIYKNVATVYNTNVFKFVMYEPLIVYYDRYLDKVNFYYLDLLLRDSYCEKDDYISMINDFFHAVDLKKYKGYSKNSLHHHEISHKNNQIISSICKIANTEVKQDDCLCIIGVIVMITFILSFISVFMLVSIGDTMQGQNITINSQYAMIKDQNTIIKNNNETITSIDNYIKLITKNYEQYYDIFHTKENFKYYICIWRICIRG